MKTLRMYIETSVWNILTIEMEKSIKGTVTKLFEEVKQKGYRIYISPIVIIEIERTKENERLDNLKKSIEIHKPELLKDVEEIGLLTEKYISANIIPQDYRADALHIAFATFYEMDVLVSYNLRHIVKMRTRRLVNYINALEGYKFLEILTPEEVIEYE